MSNDNWYEEWCRRQRQEEQEAAATEQRLAQLRRQNNPGGEPTGHFTGRCGRCGSKDLWTDNMSYGCNCCGGIYCG